MAYRDSGEPEKSAADDKAARDLDKRLQEIYAQLPVAPTLPVAEEEPEQPAPDKDDETSGAAPSADEPLVGRGMRGLGEPRRDRSEAAPSGGSVASDSPDVGGRTGGGSGLGSSRRPTETPQPTQPTFGTRSRATESNWEEDLLADDELGRGIRSPRSGTNPIVRDPLDDRARGRGRNPLDEAAGPSQRNVAPQFRRPLQSPFPQRAPRPTGFVEEAPQTPIRPSRQVTSPYSVPTVHPPGAYQFDYNP